MKRFKASKYIALFAFAVVLGMFTVSGFITMKRMQNIAEQIDNDVARNNAKTEYVNTMYEAARTRILLLYSMFLNNDAFARNDTYELFYNQAAQFVTARDNYEKSGLSEYEKTHLRLALEAIGKGAYPAQAKAADLLLRDEDYEEASRLMLEEAVPAQNKALEYLKQLVQYQRQLSEYMVKSVQKNYTDTRLFIMILGAITVFLGLVAAIYVFIRIGTMERDDNGKENA